MKKAAYSILLMIMIASVFSSCSEDEIAEPTEYLIFGHFYGFCVGDHCIQIYKLDGEGLYMDQNKTYPRHDEFYDASFVELGNKYYELVNDLEIYFPSQLLNETDTIIGCPDCADGGGLYIEYKTETIHRFWLIDQDISRVEPYLYEFMEQINDKIEEINLLSMQ